MDEVNPNSFINRNFRRFWYRKNNPLLRFAPRHKPLKRNRVKHRYSHLYSSAAWRSLRAQVLAINPLCVRCQEPATQVDHVVPHNGNDELFYDIANLQAMCVECHKKKTARGR